MWVILSRGSCKGIPNSSPPSSPLRSLHYCLLFGRLVVWSVENTKKYTQQSIAYCSLPILTPGPPSLLLLANSHHSRGLVMLWIPSCVKMVVYNSTLKSFCHKHDSFWYSVNQRIFVWFMGVQRFYALQIPPCLFWIDLIISSNYNLFYKDKLLNNQHFLTEKQNTKTTNILWPLPTQHKQLQNNIVWTQTSKKNCRCSKMCFEELVRSDGDQSYRGEIISTMY